MAKSKPAITTTHKLKSAQKIAEVSNASDSPSSATSKPIIVSNRPLIRDPMMAPPVTADKPTPEVKLPEPVAPVTTVRHERLIMPSSEAPAASDKSEPQPAAEPAKEESLAVTESFSDNEISRDNPLRPGQTDEDKAAADEISRNNTIEELVASEKYFLPVNSVGQKRVRQLLALGIILVIVLGAAWLDIALDANLIAIEGVEAPTNFFSN